ncbi:hypothetical protein DY000_02003661 [Brassica cretica]|uniref:Uncharacterized protein n=1 Tax=Brassica cretica TaxID=69181 RepID=A0ABQ7C6S5_BRACR|nr:hypothetical protein DY000_02003661 [Brassica cretica]
MALTHIVNPIIYPSPTIPRRFAAISPLETLNPQFSRHTPQHAHALSRRLFLPSVSSIWDAITGGGDSNPREAIAAIRNGMQLFRQGDVSGSVTEFDKAIVLDSRQKAYLWQRGLSLYYMDRFEEGAEQFRLDVAQNPNDTEESIWCLLCEARLHGVDVARKQFLEVGRDSRPVMREAYNLFKNGGDPEKLVNDFSSGQASEVFYASLYAGLYYEAEGKSENAKFHITAACGSPYGQRSDDYMASLAKVHCLCRNWSSGGGDSNPREAIAAIRNGMQLFRQGDVSGSVTEFDKAIVLDSRQKAYLWQRGLSLYYMDRFEEGAEQFRLDVAQNPNDTEESIWCFLCEARLHGVDVARKQFLEVGRDSRPVMREAYNLFKNGGDPEKLVNDFSSGQASEVFYASLYAGLYYEAEGKSENAKFHITAACGSPYGQRSDDYMASLAKVHCLCRNWSSGLV